MHHSVFNHGQYVLCEKEMRAISISLLLSLFIFVTDVERVAAELHMDVYSGGY